MCFQLWKIILLLGVREQLHHVTFLELAVGEAVCVMQTLSACSPLEKGYDTECCPSPFASGPHAAQPSHTLRVISLPACAHGREPDPFPRSWATSASPAPSTASASRWAPFAKIYADTFISSGWQSVSPASPESCVRFLHDSSGMGCLEVSARESTVSNCYQVTFGALLARSSS